MNPTTVALFTQKSLIQRAIAIHKPIDCSQRHNRKLSQPLHPSLLRQFQQRIGALCGEVQIHLVLVPAYQSSF